MRIRNVEDGYHGDWGLGRTTVDNDGVFLLDASVDGQGGTIRDKPVFTKDEAAFYLNRGDGIITYQGQQYESGAYWNGAAGVTSERWYGGAQSKTNVGGGALTTLTFGFYESTADILPVYSVFAGSTPGTTRLSGFSTFSAAQRDAARQAIESWDELIGISFEEQTAANADINFMNTTTGPAQASAFLPYDYGAFYEGIQGDIAVNPNQASNHLFDEGQYGLTTLIHELGHSLGLEHPGAYNFGPGFAVTYANGAEYYQDSYQYSIMSYWGGEETGMQQVDWNNLTYRYGSTPGVHDILAIQRIYGADMTTRNGNDTYGFNASLSTAGLNDDSYDFVKTPTPVVTIWDGGGIDTLDLSGYNTPSIIDINEGQMSSAGGTVDFLTLEQINANRAAEGLAPRSQATLDLYNSLFKDAYGLTNGLMHDNIAIAYGAIIENAIGGGGNDVIKGNGVANIIKGGDGLDVIKLGAGDDTFVAEVTATKLNLRGPQKGNMSVDIITDFDASGAGNDKIDLSQFANDFTFRGTNANKNAGDLTYKTFDSINGAENALGIEIDGNPGASGVGGKVSVVFGNTDGGAADFAIVLLNNASVDASDFIF